MRRKALFIFLLFLVGRIHAQSWSEKMAHTVMTIWKDSVATDNRKPIRWSYDQAVMLKGIEGLRLRTGDKKYFEYIQKSMDLLVGNDGSIHSYKPADYSLDNILPGRILLTLYKATGCEKYYQAAARLREQLRLQPRTHAGGFWHKKVYPYQMWLDGLYMAEPFYAEWAKTFHEDTTFHDIARQFILMEHYSRDPKTGLLYHGYDESKEQQWADKTTGRSPHFWARAMGWYGMALVDALEYFPRDHPERKELIRILNRYATAIMSFQDHSTGLWWDIMDRMGQPKNYQEASASCMFVYTLAKGVRLGYLPQRFLKIAQRGYEGIIKNFLQTENKLLNLKGTVSVSGLGGSPYRNGSYDYYTSEKVVVNDPKGIGAFLLASNEMELLQ